MKKLMSLIVALTLIGGAAFAAGQKAVDSPVVNGEKKRVVFIARGMADIFPALIAKCMQDEMTEGKHPLFTLEIQDAQSNNERQNSLIGQALRDKYNILVIQPNDSEAEKSAILEAAGTGVPIILTNPRIPEQALMDITNSVDADPYEQGAVVARYALNTIPQGARLVVFRGPDGNMHSVERRRAWQEEFFDKRGDVEIFREDSAHWMESEAIDFMKDWVQSSGDKPIDAVISMNDSMALGALQAVKDNSAYDKMQAYGVDGDAGAALLIRDGRLTATAFQNANDLAARILQMCDDIISGKQPLKPTVNTNITCALYTKDNVAELIAIHKELGNIR
ncbi:MAG: sugar ABC transporter substrate-binding protein [Spirochaetaceae bacterium]|jgi:inositol transport system substrate-binding protein|nr:sugar ABC transporter substrate-binding protein [Spirochaetaceae bacterium]